jgi:hypothetical protein
MYRFDRWPLTQALTEAGLVNETRVMWKTELRDVAPIARQFISRPQLAFWNSHVGQLTKQSV